MDKDIKYFDIENYEIKVTKATKINNEISIVIRNKHPPFGNINKEIISKIFDINLLYNIIYNCFNKKDNYDFTIIKDVNIIKDIHFHMKINEFIHVTFEVTFELYNKNNLIGYKNLDENITEYTLYEKPIEEFEDKIYLFTYWTEYKFDFQELKNYYENKNCENLEIKNSYDYVNKKNNPKYESDGWDIYPDNKYRYYILYYDKYFFIQNISKLIKLEKMSIDYYKYDNLEVFSNKSLKSLEIGSNKYTSLIKTISGISNFESLSKITFINCFYLENIVKILKEEKNVIKELCFIYCYKINLSELITYCTKNNIILHINYDL